MRRSVMKGFVQNIEARATKNANFRRVLYTAKNCQLVVMSLHPAEEIGMEVHKLDQFFRVEEGSGEAILDGVRSPISAGFAVLVPAGTKHNIVNTSAAPLKLYTLYAPPNHRDGVVHRTRADAEKDNNQADARGSIPQAPQWLAQFRPRATNVGTRASADAASRAGADRGGHY